MMDETYLGTLLGVGQHPVVGLAVVLTLDSPEPQQTTAHRLVTLLSTGEAGGVTGRAGDGQLPPLHHPPGHTEGQAAVRARAPPQPGVGLDVAGTDELVVSLPGRALWQQLQHSLVINNDLAVAGTLNLRGALEGGDPGGDVLHPALCAELVATGETQHPLPSVVVANLTLCVGPVPNQASPQSGPVNRR